MSMPITIGFRRPGALACPRVICLGRCSSEPKVPAERGKGAGTSADPGGGLRTLGTARIVLLLVLSAYPAGPAALAQLGDRLRSGQDPAEFGIEVRRRDPSELIGGDRAPFVVVEVEGVRRVNREVHLEAEVGAH